MNVNELVPLPTTKVVFKHSIYKKIPKCAGCYVIATFDENILYIGLSKNLHERFQQHLENKEKTEPTINGKAVWFYFSLYDPSNLPKLERTWLNQFVVIHGHRPIMNKVDSPIS